MSYVRDLVLGEIRLEGDDFGASSAVFQLPAPPSGAKKMQFVFKLWLDTITADRKWTGKGWNHTNYFGLSFNADTHRFAVPANLSSIPIPDEFFGWMNLTPSLDTGTTTWPPNPAETQTVDRFGICHGANFITGSGSYSSAARMGCNDGGQEQHTLFLDGNGAVLIAASGATNSTDEPHCCIPANPTLGADFTGGWEIHASNVDKTMYAALVLHGDNPGFAGDAMFDIFPATPAPAGFRLRNTYTLHGDVTSNFRPSLDVVNFPGYLKFRYSGADENFVFKEARIKYFDEVDTEL